MRQVNWDNTNSVKYYLLICLAVIVSLLFFRPFVDDISPKKVESIADFNINRVGLKANTDIAKKFHHKVYFNVPVKPDFIIFGNKNIGYFKTKKFSWQQGQVELEIIPPTYKTTISFFVGDKKYHGQKFKAYNPQILKKIKIEIEGEFDAPFYGVTGIMHVGSSDDFDRAVFPMVINKFGEIIWAHIPDKGERNFKKYLTMKMLANDKIATLYSEQSSYFEVINLKGKQLDNYSGKKQNPPIVMHHDFDWNEQTKKLITFSNEIGYFRPFHLNHSLWQNLKDLMAKPISYVSSSLVNIDLQTNYVETMMTGIDFFPHYKGELGALIMSYLAPIESKVWARWGERVQYDHLHANSLERTKEGWLLSYRNHSKLVMLDHDFKKVLWTLGNDKSDDYRAEGPRHAFYHQHHASLTSTGDILLVDNHVSPPAPNVIGSRILKMRRFKDGTFKVIWNYQPHYHFSTRTRGSAYELQNYNILAFYPQSLSGADQLFEVDLATGQPIGHMKISFGVIERKISDEQAKRFQERGETVLAEEKIGGGNRALPIYDFNASYLGQRI